MRDGMTRKFRSPAEAPQIQDFLEQYVVKLLLVAGPDAGAGFAIDRERVIVGRGPGVDRAFEDPSMSRQHAVIEYCGTGFRIRDLGSTNGTRVNGAAVQSAELGHGDRIEMGAQSFVLAVEERELEPDAYELSS